MANPEHERVLRESVRRGDYSVDMSGFDLSRMLFSSIRLLGAKLSGANLRGADLSGGQFCGCDFRDAEFHKARITLGDFRNANLSGADMTASDLNASVMTGANLANANLSRANLVKTRLDGATLTAANLDRTDLRGVRGLTEVQLASATNNDKAILDERTLAAFHRTGDLAIARRGRPTRKRPQRNQVDLIFAAAKPCFGDVFLLCGHQHPDFAPTGDYGFQDLADLGVEQVDDYFALCVDGDPAVWVFPLVNGQVVEHHPGPFDGLRIELADGSRKKLWSKCVMRFREGLHTTIGE